MISIIIVHYNVKNHLKLCLDTLYKYHNTSLFEVIIIDNNSDEKINDITNNRKNLSVYYSKDNKGYSKAVNYGIEKSKGSKILLLNPDIILNSDILNEMNNYLNTHNDVGIIGAKVLYANGKYQASSKRSFPYIYLGLVRLLFLDKLFYFNEFFGKYNYSYINKDTLLEVDSISGACMMFDKSLIERIGFFDDRYFLYFEDTDFCYRARKNNYKVIYNPNVEIIHIKRQSFKNSNYSANYEFYKSLYCFYIKYYDDYKNFAFTKVLVKVILKLLICFFGVFNRKK